MKGIFFGIASGVITTLGLLTGLYASTHAKIVVISGILVIAVVDALSDAFGMHLSVEVENKYLPREIWGSMIATFITKLLIALSFIVPVLLFNLNLAVFVSCAWGLFVIAAVSVYLARLQNLSACLVVLEHIFIAVIVILIANGVGYLISLFQNLI